MKYYKYQLYRDSIGIFEIDHKNKTIRFYSLISKKWLKTNWSIERAMILSEELTEAEAFIEML